MLTWLIRIVLLVLLVFGSLVGIVLIAEPEIDLSAYRDTVSQRLGNLAGRNVQFGGDIRLKLGRHAALHLTRVQLANADWAEDEKLLSAGRVSVGIDLLALASGKVHLEGIVLRDIDVALERSATGETSWNLRGTTDDEPADNAKAHPISLIVEDAQVERVRARYRSAQRTEPLVVAIERLTQHARDRMLMLDGNGTINQSSLTLAGQVGTLDALLAGRDIDLDLSMSIQDTVMRLRGRLGDPENLVGIELEGGIRGPSLDPVLALLGVDDGPGGNIDAHFTIGDRDPGIEADIRGNVGAMQIAVSGIVGNPVAADDVSMDVSLTGNDLSILGRLLGQRDLPAESYNLQGRIRRHAQKLQVVDAVATSGASKVALSAELPAFPTLTGGTAEIDVHLSELRNYLPAGRAQMAPGPLTARLQVETGADGGSRLDAQIDHAGNILRLNGLVGRHPAYQGTRLAFAVDIPNVQQLNLSSGRAARGAVSLSASGSISVDDRQQALLTLSDGWLGEMHIEASGTLGRTPSMTGTDLTVKVEGPSLQSLASAFIDARLPQHSYRAEARLQGDVHSVSITSMQAQVGETRLRSDGSIGPLPGLRGTNTRVELVIPRIADLLPHAVDGTWAQAGYRVQGQLRVQDRFIHLTDGVIRGDRIDGSLSARIADDLDLHSARAQVRLRTPALSTVLPVISGYTAPDAPLSLAVAVQPTENGIGVRELDVRLADATLRADGSISLGGAAKSSLKFEAKGPSLGQLGSFGATTLPAEPFALTGTLRHLQQRYAIDDLALQLGDGSLKGRIAVVTSTTPSVDIDLASQGKVFGFLAVPADTTTGTAGPEEQDLANKRKAVIPDSEIELGALARVNGRLRLAARNAGYPDPVFPDRVIVDALDLDVQLQDGRLTLEKLEIAGDRGQLDFAGGIEPQGNQFGVNLALEARNMRFGFLAAGTGLDALPSHKVSVNLAGLGDSYRSVATSLNGSIRIEGGNGETNNTRTNQALGRFTNDLISTLNPFQKSESHTRIDCTAAAANVTDGVLQLFPGGVIRTDKIDIAASGTIDLATERIDVQFRSIPRQGIGISVASIVRPYVKVGGTLSQPGMTLDAPKALLSGTAAVATGGLSILATSLLDRASGSINPCVDIMSKADSGKASSTLNPIDILGDAINRRTSPNRPSLSDED
ncbi:MAG: AsmA family protein [Gammaproteobacteria bacterium]|nr:AsmA family protein [Gammaproteobacteria bacterium]